MKIAKDHVVSFDYKVRNSRAEILDSSEETGAMAYLHGHASIIPGLEKALEGKSAGEELDVVVAPVDAYGLRDERRVAKVERSIFPAGADIKPGMRFRATSEHGSDFVVVMAVDGDTITVDANHPLAGETLTFNVTVREVRAATADEIAHGHVHQAHHAGHDGEGCCGGHGHKHKHDGDECCGGHGHKHKHDSEGCCGGGGCGGH